MDFALSRQWHDVPRPNCALHSRNGAALQRGNSLTRKGAFYRIRFSPRSATLEPVVLDRRMGRHTGVSLTETSRDLGFGKRDVYPLVLSVDC